VNQAIRERIASRLERLYGPVDGGRCLARIGEVVDSFRSRIAQTQDQAQVRDWDESDILLITYGDMVRAKSGESPLRELLRFLSDESLDELLSTVHILPFFPYSSDDGFSVIDYRAVDPALGNWEDIAALRENFRLAFDLVLNHASRESEWFAKYLQAIEPYSRFFVEADPEADLSAVTRPRSLPLLTPFETASGTRHVWTTFSADQVDLNFAEPELLVAMLEVLLDYAARGAQVIRLDAIAFLWKEIGTNCVHLQQTHEVVKLMRDVLEVAAPHVWILSETNVPHQENISYFGDGDEAHLVYQFSLPPLLLDAFTHADATHLRTWLQGLEATAPGTTFLNFTASHDGVGVRPLEGLVPPERVASLVEALRVRGSLVNTRRSADGTDVPYELNITYVDALTPDDPKDTELHARRFLASQAFMLALRGIPALYFHSLVGTRNDIAGVEQSGHARRINRRKFERTELDAQVADPDSLAQRIYCGYRHLLSIRREQPAFHPEAEQRVVDLGSDRLIGFERQAAEVEKSILVATNFSSEPTHLKVDQLEDRLTQYHRDLITGNQFSDDGSLVVAPGQTVWLSR
jgi:glycosidase